MQGRTKTLAAAAALLMGTTALSGCSLSGSSPASSKTITVAYEEYGDFTQLNTEMQTIKKEYQTAHPGYTVDLEPIQAAGCVENNRLHSEIPLLPIAPERQGAGRDSIWPHLVDARQAPPDIGQSSANVRGGVGIIAALN